MDCFTPRVDPGSDLHLLRAARQAPTGVCPSVLREIPKTRQIAGEPARRWFTDEDMDLVVWLDDVGEGLVGFQLAYDKLRSEHALTWRRGRGFRHESVDDGEGRPGKHKAAPVMLADGDFPAAMVATRFKQRSARMDQGIAGFVHGKLLEFSGDTGTR